MCLQTSSVPRRTARRVAAACDVGEQIARISIGTSGHDGTEEVSRHVMKAEQREKLFEKGPAFLFPRKVRRLRQPGAQQVVSIVLRPQLERLGPEQDLHHPWGQHIDVTAEGGGGGER